MTKLNSFWASAQPQVDTLEGIQEYLKPRDRDELLGLFVPELPTVEESQSEPQQLDSVDVIRDDLLEQYGMTPEDFAQTALSEPELWSPEEVEKFYGVLAGEVSPEEIVELAHDYASGARKKPPEAKVAVSTPEEDWDFSSDMLEQPSFRLETGINPDMAMGSIDVGEWWNSKK